jgi:hypothetical protein
LSDPNHFQEGDYIETSEGLYFTVKGMFHPEDKVLSVLRYIPDEGGDRVKNTYRYKRVYNLVKTKRFLEKNYPHYLSYIPRLGITTQSVPISNIKKIYKPREKLKEIIDTSNQKPIKILRKLVYSLNEESEVSLECFGITGSILIDMHTPDSDIDINVYGFEQSKRVYDALKKLRLDSNWLKPYTKKTVKNVLESRWSNTGLDLKLFLEIETNKVLHGRVEDKDYFIRLIKPINIPDKSEPIEVVKIRKTIKDDSEGIFTPCKYMLEISSDNEPIELLSYRGKFTEQVKKGELIEARGTLEKVWEGNKIAYRLVLGRKGDYLLPVRLLDE